MGLWQDSVQQTLALGPEHLSLYALTLEAATPLSRQIERGVIPAPDDDLTADMYEWAEEALEQSGYVHYEVSNWALPGRQCRHNLIYWRNEPYIGLGAGAHSWWTGVRRANLDRPEEYIRAVEEGRLPIAEREAIDRSLEMGETMIMGLRLLDEGVPEERFRRRFGAVLQQVYAEQIADLVQRDLVEVASGRIRLTRRGHLLGNQVFAQFI